MQKLILIRHAKTEPYAETGTDESRKLTERGHEDAQAISIQLKSMGLSLELVIVLGTLILATLFILLHYHRQILLFCAPWLGGLGRSIQTRWGNNDAAH